MGRDDSRHVNFGDSVGQGWRSSRCVLRVDVRVTADLQHRSRPTHEGPVAAVEALDFT
jgi:hypothetical protein